LLAGTVWPFVMSGSISRRIVHGAHLFEPARIVLTLGVDAGPLDHYLLPPLQPMADGVAGVRDALEEQGVGLLIDERQLAELRAAAASGGWVRRFDQPAARFAGFVPHAGERQVWLWFAPPVR